MQPFNADGNLTPGIHAYSLEDFKTQFIDEFPQSESRPEIYGKFIGWIKQIVEVLPPAYVWLDGSYLTQKTNPKDIDLVVFYRPEDIPTQEVSDTLSNLINVVSRELKCDAYFCYLFDHWPPEELARSVDPSTTTRRTYWMGQFGFDREEKPKGIIQLSQAELTQIGGVAV